MHVVDGVVDKIEPNHWNPNNYSNLSSDFFDGYTEEYGCAEGGAICPKGNAGIRALYDPDRVTKPLKRTNPDKSPDADPRFEAISWDQALSEITEKLGDLRDAGDAHRLLWISEDHSFTHIQDDFCELFGSPNYSNHSNLCDVSRKASFKTVMGNERPLADFLESRYIMLFGWNPTSAIKWVYLPRILTRAVEHGARLVVVDPYLSDTAAKAHEWVSIRPGTDGALALAMAHVIIRDALYDHDFVTAWTSGFDAYANHVADKTPEWAEEITSIPAATIERLARELATTKPALVDTWSGPGQHSNAVQGGRAIALLNALIGSWDAPGGMMIPDKRGEKHAAVKPDATAEAGLEEPRFDQLDTYPLGHKSGVYARMFTNLLDGTGPYEPAMLMCVFQNPVMSVLGGGNVAEALGRLETLVVVDTMLSETAMLADYVLPGTTYLERYDLNSHWVTWPVLGLRQPVVEPLFGQPTEYEIVAELGRRIELRDADGRDFSASVRCRANRSRTSPPGTRTTSRTSSKRGPRHHPGRTPSASRRRMGRSQRHPLPEVRRAGGTRQARYRVVLRRSIGRRHADLRQAQGRRRRTHRDGDRRPSSPWLLHQQRQGRVLGSQPGRQAGCRRSPGRPAPRGQPARLAARRAVPVVPHQLEGSQPHPHPHPEQPVAARDQARQPSGRAPGDRRTIRVRRR